MKKYSLAKTLFCFISFCLLACSTVSAATISYSLTEIETNLYEMTYYVDGFDSTTYAGFDIYFDAQTYSQLTLTAQETDNWDTAYILVADDIYGEVQDWGLNAYALTADTDLSGYFTVTFCYEGEGLPGVQDIEFYDADYAVVATGQTSAVPVPGAMVILFSGLAGLCAVKRRF